MVKEHPYREYFILDMSDAAYINAPKVFVLPDEKSTDVLARFDSLAEAKIYIDKLIHTKEFNTKFDDFVSDKEPANE